MNDIARQISIFVKQLRDGPCLVECEVAKKHTAITTQSDSRRTSGLKLIPNIVPALLADTNGRRSEV